MSMIVYPAQYESDVVLRDGSTLRLRPVRSGMDFRAPARAGVNGDPKMH